MTQATVTTPEDIIGVSEHIQNVRQQIKDVAENDLTVLIVGPTGTGKELIARAIHYSSSRSYKRLLALNCAGIAETLAESELFGHEKGAFTGADRTKSGKFEQAHGGTLFLDEIGDMPDKIQAKILRVLEEREITRVGGEKDPISVDVRLIAATNKDLSDKKNFREELYYRLDECSIQTEPLASRREDIVCLVNHFAHKPALKLDPRVKFLLYEHDFLGNVRELKNLLKHDYDYLKRKLSPNGQIFNETTWHPMLETVRWIDRYAEEKGIKFIEYVVEAYEILTLWHSTELTKREIAEKLHIRPEKLSPKKFKSRFYFDLPSRQEPSSAWIRSRKIFPDFTPYLFKKTGAEIQVPGNRQ
jgi:transcriptional regulator with GAF, ATPase, and Fis domain